MNKSTIFFLAFMISFMTIYSVYYYGQRKKLDQSVVALAKDLPHTVVGAASMADKDKNMIYTRGIAQIELGIKSDSPQFLSNVPDENFVFFRSKNVKDSLEKFYEGLVTKFQNHPPIEFKDVKDGDRVLLSYYFQNIRLPGGFRVSASPVDFHGTPVKALQYHPSKNNNDTNVAFYKNELTKEYAIKVKMDAGKKELVIYSTSNDSGWMHNYKSAGALISNETYKYKPAQDESVLFPDLDFSVVKDYTKEEQKSNAVFNPFTLVEERIKFKVSAPKEGGPLEADSKYNTAKNYQINGASVLYYIKESGHNPFCIIDVKNTEILKRLKK
jgi:hypothetical protein